jgi:hypothetical protein
VVSGALDTPPDFVEAHTTLLNGAFILLSESTVDNDVPYYPDTAHLSQLEIHLDIHYFRLPYCF